MSQPQPDTNSNTGTLPPPPPPPVVGKLESITESIKVMTTQLEKNNEKITEILEQKVQACTRIEGIKTQINDSRSDLGDIAESTIGIVDLIKSEIQSGKVGADQDTTEITTLIAELKRINEAKKQMQDSRDELDLLRIRQKNEDDEQLKRVTQEKDDLIKQKDEKIIEMTMQLQDVLEKMDGKNNELSILNSRLSQTVEEGNTILQNLNALEKEQSESKTLVNNLEKQIDALKKKVEEQSDLLSTSSVQVVVGEWREYLGKKDGVNDNFFQKLQSEDLLTSVEQTELLSGIEQYIQSNTTPSINIKQKMTDTEKKMLPSMQVRRSWMKVINVEGSLLTNAQEVMDDLGFYTVPGDRLNLNNALVLLYILIIRAKLGGVNPENMDSQTWTELTRRMISSIKDNLQELPEPLKGLLTTLFKKPVFKKPDTKSGGKRKRSIKKKRQPKKNITIKKKYKKNKKMPKKKIKKKHTIHKKRRNNKNKTLRRRK